MRTLYLAKQESLCLFEYECHRSSEVTLLSHKRTWRLQSSGNHVVTSHMGSPVQGLQCEKTGPEWPAWLATKSLSSGKGTKERNVRQKKSWPMIGEGQLRRWAEAWRRRKLSPLSRSWCKPNYVCHWQEMTGLRAKGREQEQSDGCGKDCGVQRGHQNLHHPILPAVFSIFCRRRGEVIHTGILSERKTFKWLKTVFRDEME